VSALAAIVFDVRAWADTQIQPLVDTVLALAHVGGLAGISIRIIPSASRNLFSIA
jgi:hypothetical protein